MRTFGRIILSVLTAALSESKASEQSQTPKQRIDIEDKKGTFRRALKCTRCLVDFHLYAQYKVHTNASLRAMQYCWAEFHQNKSVFLEFRGLKNTIKASKLAVQRLREEQNLALTSPAEGMAGPIRQNLSLKRK